MIFRNSAVAVQIDVVLPLRNDRNTNDYAGYIIPKLVIENFLYDFKHLKSGDIATFGFKYMLCENESLRRKYNIVHPVTFVVI